jgi:valyl-tRNA synthetase
MDSKYQPQKFEKKIYQFWEENKLFEAKVHRKKKPFSIILPPPNANADLHLGHAMYVYEDIMIRYHKILGDEVLWLPGADHAGFETQYVFEKELQKKGQSRFDYDRETLYKMIWDFVKENRPRMEQQLRRLGFFLDWSRNKFTLDEDIVKIVYETFKKLYDEGLIYRAKRLVNYCTGDGTSFSDLEVKYVEKNDPLYYMKYGPFTLATVRPETKFGDTALAVNPKDKRYKKWVGQVVEAEGLLGKFKIKVISDAAVDPKFGTGVVKITPAHDFNDFETGQRHNLEVRQVIGFDGRLNQLTGPYAGLKVAAARQKVVEDLKKRGFIVKVDEKYSHRVGTCYKCGRVLEPLPLEQWYVKVRPLAEAAKKLLLEKKIKIIPARFKKALIQWLDNFYDWNISRQIVWGIRIPAYKCKNSKFEIRNSKLEEKWFVSVEKPKKCQICGKCSFEQDRDTFDTWFSSAQWPYATLLSQSRISNEKKYPWFNYFYPTTVMETAYDILPWWVARMMMIGYQLTKKVPFENVFFHGLVRDKKGQKMSKSKGNVINPLDMVDKYGADALRVSLVFGVKEGGDQSLSEEKIIGMRNFANKIWNIARFIYMNREIKNQKSKIKSDAKRHPEFISESDSGQARMTLEKLQKEFEEEKKKYLKYMNSYRFSMALDLIYHFLWHRFADYYIEELKEELRDGNIRILEVLKKVYFENLIMLHPFMPFVTEAVWKVFHGEDSSILEVRSGYGSRLGS